MQVDKGLLDSSSVVRIRVRMPGEKSHEASGASAPPRHDELFEFPTEARAKGSTRAAWAGVVCSHARGLARVSTLVVFACGVMVGVLSVTPDAPVPVALRVPAPVDRPSRIEPRAPVELTVPAPASLAPELPPVAGLFLYNELAGIRPLNLDGTAAVSATLIPIVTR